MAKASSGKHAQPSTSKKTSKIVTGAPSQLNQSSRKGKRAWRKNVDIQEVEEGMEEMRAEERVIGSVSLLIVAEGYEFFRCSQPLQVTKDQDLFTIDVQGDAKVRKNLHKFSSAQLTSTKILAQRSAVPAVFSRSTSDASKKRKALVSHDEKSRLLRIGKRPRKGPFNSVIDPTEFGAGSAMLELSEAVKNSGTYDVWTPPSEETEVPMGLEIVQPKSVKAPTTKPTRNGIDLQAVPEPHQGTSYNPTVESHQDLLLKAHEAEEKRLRELDKHAEVKKKMENARTDESVENFALAAELDEKRTTEMTKLKQQGLVGQKLGRHKVPEGPVDVQLGEDLSESLRALKPEGNLFRDRFVSMQHRALVEPRTLVVPKKRRTKIVEYEKHAWKRFE
ncbi:hypothetical protein H0H93_011226 [Arthromyces matolae]|nr:hypothetical protein H0H93_011226 [Arthromyces matolae]